MNFSQRLVVTGLAVAGPELSAYSAISDKKALSNAYLVLH